MLRRDFLKVTVGALGAIPFIGSALVEALVGERCCHCGRVNSDTLQLSTGHRLCGPCMDRDDWQKAHQAQECVEREDMGGNHYGDSI